MEMENVGKTAQKGFLTFLADKPIWASWIAYSLVTGVMFSVFYAAMMFMAQLWWVPIMITIVFGVIWGTVAFSKMPESSKARKTGK